MNPEPNPITAGIDFSASSESVLRKAARAAKRAGASVLAVYVIDSGSLAFRAVGVGKDGDTLVEQATAKMEALISRFGLDGVITVIRTGNPAVEIAAVMREHDSKLLVIAANDSVKKRLGSIASRCVRTAPGDVLVLRDWQEKDFKKIMVCTDFSATSTKALERGIFMAEVSNAALELVHVMYPPDMDPWGEVMDQKMDAAESYGDTCKRQTEEKMARQVAAYTARLTALDFTSTILVSTNSTQTLTSHARYIAADLVVLGTRGISKVEGFFIGTNAERLLHDVGVCVLAVRD
jgi:nucleotide-binding universal stress UspA family protein